MYNELVEALRLCVKYGKAEDALVNAQKAVNAIEELQERVKTLTRELDEVNQDADYANAAATALHGALPRWIPVTEKPPLKVGDDGYNGYLVLANGFCEVADYTVDESGVLCFFVDGEYEPDITHFVPISELPKLDGGRGNV